MPRARARWSHRPTPDAGGYWLATVNGQVFGFGDAKVFGSMATKHLVKPIVGIEAAGGGYCCSEATAGCTPSATPATGLGRAGPVGSPVVAMAAGPAGQSYWLATGAGSILRFGAVPFGPAKRPSLGSAVAAMAATPDAKGYWLVTQKARFGRMGTPITTARGRGPKTNIVGIAPTANGKGYWLAARDGAVFAFGDAQSWPGRRPGRSLVRRPWLGKAV